MKTVIEKELCTGCTACFASCPNQSIKMVADEAGFLYPEIQDSCIDCGKCRRICPRINQTEGESLFTQKAYAAVSKDFKIWKRSSSGGAFSEICLAWNDGNTMFCAACWDKLYVKHDCVVGTEDISRFCKSKYISSNVGNTYEKVKEQLEKGCRVLFCGTPCQVAGIKKYLNKDYNGLLLVDIICHGVGSPAVFGECVKLLEKSFSKRIVSYEFRSKKSVFDRDHITKLVFENQKKPIYITDDRYIQLFVKQHCLREACSQNCIYRDEHRQGDITIGDFKGLTKVFPHLVGTKKNYSTVVFNTPKGESVFEKLSERMNMLLCGIDSIKQYNPIFYRHTFSSEKRDEFFKDFSDNPKSCIEKWTTPEKMYRKNLKGKVFDILPQVVRRWINER